MKITCLLTSVALLYLVGFGTAFAAENTVDWLNRMDRERRAKQLTPQPKTYDRSYVVVPRRMRNHRVLSQ
jgi:hypothetical protein